MKKLLVAAFVVAILASNGSYGGEKQMWAKSYLGKPAPEITVQKWISKEPDRKGKFVLIDFWATWCPPCRKAVEELNRYHEKFGDKLVVMGISDEKEGVVRQFTSDHIKYFSAMDESAALKKKYEVTGIPHCVIIDPNGIVVWEGFPFLSGYELTDGVVESLLKKAPEGWAVEVVKSIAAMRRLSAQWRRAGASLAFVPTMGFLHRGHFSLMQQARKSVGRAGKVVVSIFVNPTQFGPKEDFSKYPRDLKRDKELCREAGVDCIFLPATGDMYAQGFSTWVNEEKLSKGMEGESRPGHFRGVATVVAKLFNIVGPDAAVFGAKDFQQAAVIQRLVRDLNFPVKIIVAPTVREKDGLALSSRNKYLSNSQRAQATVLSRAIAAAKKIVSRAPVSVPKLEKELRELIQAEPEARVDSISLFDPHSLEPVKTARRGTHLALAVFIGNTRLIDNATL